MSVISREDIVQWDVRTWSRALDFWEKEVNWSGIDSALELGGREGGLSLWLANKGIETVCSDYEKTEETATPLHQKHGVGEKISYLDIDATNIPFENKFDLIVFKSIVGGIGRGNNKEIQRKVFQEIYKALKPGGVLLFAENLTSTQLHQKLRERHNNWGDYWRYLTLNEIAEFLQPFSRVNIRSTGVLATLGRNEKQKTLLSYVDSIALNKLTPKNWHYLGYGIAVK